MPAPPTAAPADERSREREPGRREAETGQHREHDVGEHAVDERRDRRQDARGRRRRDQLGAAALLLGARVPHGEEGAHQSGEQGEEGVDLEEGHGGEAGALRAGRAASGWPGSRSRA